MTTKEFLRREKYLKENLNRLRSDYAHERMVAKVGDVIVSDDCAYEVNSFEVSNDLDHSGLPEVVYKSQVISKYKCRLVFNSAIEVVNSIPVEEIERARPKAIPEYRLIKKGTTLRIGWIAQPFITSDDIIVRVVFDFKTTPESPTKGVIQTFKGVANCETEDYYEQYELTDGLDAEVWFAMSESQPYDHYEDYIKPFIEGK